MKCVVCHKNEATVPDREDPAHRVRVCLDCHGARLGADLRNVVAQAARRRARNQEGGKDASESV